MPLRQFVSKLSPRGWAAVGGAAAVSIVFLVLVFQLASAPSYSTMEAGLDPAQTGKITAALDAKGISYQIQNNGTAIAVQPGQTAQARIALATAGLLTSNSSQQALSSVSNMSLGASNFQQQIIYQSALETQLVQTIEQIQGISGAQVQLVLPNPQDQMFGDSTPASAAVLLSNSGSLDPSAVKGIAQLVSSSVPGLSSSKVTITDSTGQLLWPSSDGSTGGGDGSLLAKQSAQARYDSALAAQVNAMLAQTLGPNKAVVQVNADLNTNQTTADSLTYANKGVALTQHTEKETLTGGSGTTAAGAGAAGAAGNIPGYASTATGAGTGNSNYNHTITDTTYGINKTVTHSVISPGAINRQTVSLLVDRAVPASALPAIRAAVQGAVGLNPKRGDSLFVGQMPFVKSTTTTTKASPTTKMLGYAKYLAVGLGALIFLFFAARMVRRREREALVAEPTWLRELEGPRPLPALSRTEMGTPEPPTQVAPLQAPVNVARRQLEDLVDRDADRVAQQVRAWMAED